MRLRTALEIGLVLLAAAATVGCDQGRTAPPKTNVQVVHAAPSHPSLSFLREERAAVTDLGYGSATSPLPFDEDLYNFHVEMVVPSASAPSRIASFVKEVFADVDYTFVLAENATGGVEPIIVETPVAAADGPAQLAAVHTGAALPAIDVYVEPPGTDLTTATPLGSLTFRGTVTGATRPAGEYAVTVTEAGNPSAVLLASGSGLLQSAQHAVFVIVPGAGEGTAPLRVVLVQDDPTVLLDQNLSGAIRIVNAAADQAARDAAIGTDFTPPLFAGVPFGTISSYAMVAPGDQTLSVTPAGNPGVVETTESIAVAGGRLYTTIIAGAPGSIDVATLIDDPRRTFDRAQLALLNGASQFASLTFYVLRPGVDPATVAPVATLTSPGGTQYVGLAPGEYQLALRDPDQLTVAGPLTISVVAGGLYAALAVNGADAATASFVLLDDFVPAP